MNNLNTFDFFQKKRKGRKKLNFLEKTNSIKNNNNS